MWGKEQIAPPGNGLKGKDLLFAHSFTPNDVNTLFEIFEQIDQGKTPSGFDRKKVLLIPHEFNPVFNFMGLAASTIDCQVNFQYCSGQDVGEIMALVTRYNPDLVVLDTPEIAPTIAGHSVPPVINVASGVGNPCEALAGLFIIKKALGRIDDLHLFLGTVDDSAVSLLALLCSLGKRVNLGVLHQDLENFDAFLRRNLITSGISLMAVTQEDASRAEVIYDFPGRPRGKIGPGTLVFSRLTIEGFRLPTQMAVLEAVLGKE